MRRKKISSKHQLKHETQIAKLRTERIKLKTMEYTLQLAAQSKQRIADQKRNDGIAAIQKMANDIMLSMMDDLESKLARANAELAVLRRAR